MNNCELGNGGIGNGELVISQQSTVNSQQSTMPNAPFPMPNSRVLWIGIGCQRGTSRESIETAIQQVCHSYNLPESAIAGIATIDTKANETGIIELCQHRNWGLKTFPANILNSVEVPNPSHIVGQKVGTYSVAEAAALCAIELTSYTMLKNRQDAFSTKSESDCGMGILPARQRLLVPKQIFRGQEKPGYVTVAVAVCAIEYLR